MNRGVSHSVRDSSTTWLVAPQLRKTWRHHGQVSSVGMRAWTSAPAANAFKALCGCSGEQRPEGSAFPACELCSQGKALEQYSGAKASEEVIVQIQ
mmetsp:Transcript_668/g.1782  ORF Transcript_668/g.1782 Transcript_668/m.1782 type:complete len:96 (-) Transcript_668:802-1089(-)